VPLIEAGQSMHEFVFDNLKERLTTARKRIEALLPSSPIRSAALA
jgi:hypothetical protein